METHAHQAPQPGPGQAPEHVEVTFIPSREEHAELEIVRKLAVIMDSALTIPGTNIKFGLDAVLGLIPVLGDLGSAAISAYMLRAAGRLRVPAVVQTRMMLNIMIDTAIGMVPFFGDYLDVLYKANMKNAALLQHAVENRQTAGRSSWFVLIGMFALLIALLVGGFVGAVLLAKWAWNLSG